MLFDRLVWAVMEYGVVICGRRREGRLQERYLKWVLGVESGMPGYMVKEELGRAKLRCRVGGVLGVSRRDWWRGEGAC